MTPCRKLRGCRAPWRNHLDLSLTRALGDPYIHESIERNSLTSGMHRVRLLTKRAASHDEISKCEGSS